MKRPRKALPFGTALILAGGKSSRMGYDKQYLEVCQERLMEKMIRDLSVTFSDIIVVTKEPKSYTHLPVRLASDRFHHAGPLAGLEVGLAMARSDYVFLRACDMPVYVDSYVRYMMDQVTVTGDEVVTTIVQGYVEPFNTFYHKSLHPKVVSLLKGRERSFRKLIEGRSVLEIPEERARFFDPDLTHFINLNTKEDLRRYCDRFCL